ncbi:hypothetical protein M9Y10_003206 [Tritrichomonas musculus]|uniref:F5/8 type C domain-containing protein n=1 Tax=Tritrichomonas musculus TaxID=1915356 RepID=A0ABR2JP99_9EUKA
MNKENQQFLLSFDNFKEIPFDKYEKNFTFIVNGKQYQSNRFVADILSPIIREYHYNDESIDHIAINIKEEKSKTSQEENYFTDFLSLINFIPKELDEAKITRYKQYFLQLGNINEYLRLESKTNIDINPQNVIDRLEFLISNIKNSQNYKKEEENTLKSKFISEMIQYASSHFPEISIDKLKKLPLSIIDEIIGNEALKLEDEDALLNFILDLYEENDIYSILFSHVKFEHLSQEMISKFINAFNIDHLNSEIWRRMCQRFILTESKTNEEIKTFELDKKKQFNGIMRYLSEETSGNIHDNGTINITSNSIYRDNDSYHPKNLVDYQTDNYYESKSGVQDATVCFDFKDKLIQISSYSIKTIHLTSYDPEHPRNWVLEVSNDNKAWHAIDEHKDDATLNGANLIKTFNTKIMNEFYRFVRFRQTGVSWTNNYYVRFNLIEFYGKLKQKNAK